MEIKTRKTSSSNKNDNDSESSESKKTEVLWSATFKPDTKEESLENDTENVDQKISDEEKVSKENDKETVEKSRIVLDPVIEPVHNQIPVQNIIQTPETVNKKSKTLGCLSSALWNIFNCVGCILFCIAIIIIIFVFWINF